MTDNETRSDAPGAASSAALEAREKRLLDAATLRRPDKIPVAPLVHYYAAASQGAGNAAMHYDLVLRNRVFRDTTIEHDWDAAAPVGAIPEGRPLELLGTGQYRWPGGALNDGQPFQFVEGEYMLQDEYDEMLADPAGFAVRKLWPRVAPALAPAAALRQCPAAPDPLLSRRPRLGRVARWSSGEPRCGRSARDAARFREGIDCRLAARWPTTRRRWPDSAFPCSSGPRRSPRSTA